MKSLQGITVALAIVLFGASSALTTQGTKESRYKIYSRGIRVGELVSSISHHPASGEKVLKYVSTCSIKAHFVVYSYTMENREEALVGEGGTFSYLRTERENESKRRVEGKLVNGKFHLQVQENGVNRTVVVDRNQYDSTTMECPEVAMKKEGDHLELRLLDFETLSVVTRKYTWIKSEEITVGGKTFHCRVIDFEDANKKCRRWIKPDEPGVIITRQDGRGKNGSYSLRMINHSDIVNERTS
ncbi:hypothetical protein [Geobacter argillaceus]|uniref:hypothetical protein n=1 Tax=Geobacter argillaceus TaxID=345631 RepID=UPI0011A02A68|nr:hypothetical protein [Geobacter argillaceus]